MMTAAGMIEKLGVTGLGIAAWMFLWLLRPRYDSTRKQDLLLFIACLGWQNRQHVPDLLASTPQGLINVALFLLGIYATAFSWAYLDTSISLSPADQPKGPPPWLLPAKTSHTRFFPRKHSFAYKLLQVAIHIDSHGRFGSLVSVGDVQTRGWFHVDPSDYLARSAKIKSKTADPINLRSKLRTFLREQGVSDEEWNDAWLVTAPRFLGYAFNPVSFWYVYDKERELVMMVLEVNNTFGERRPYLLRAKTTADKSDDSSSGMPERSAPTNAVKMVQAVPGDGNFKQAWTKDFHVSPFNSRKGFYTLSATNPFRGKEIKAPAVVNNIITLKSSKDHAKLVASISSIDAALDPLVASWTEVLKFMWRWWWVGFMTFPRILVEAAKLFWRKGLHVWFRPEIMVGSLARREDKIETDLAQFFEMYLDELVAKHDEPLRVEYASNLAGREVRVITNVKATQTEFVVEEKVQVFDMRVMSPVFFARFPHYACSSDAFDQECIFTDEKNRTIWLSDPQLMSRLLESHGSPKAGLTSLWWWTEKVRWWTHRQLRCHPAATAYPATASAVSQTKQIARDAFSELDHFVLETLWQDASQYRRMCARLFLAQRFALGFVPVVDAVDFLLRVAFAWTCAKGLVTVEEKIIMQMIKIAVPMHLFAFGKG